MANNGNKGKFSDRIKKMRFDRLKKKKGVVILEDSNTMYSNFMKVVAAVPLLVYDNVFDKDVKNSKELRNDEITSNFELNHDKLKEKKQIKRQKNRDLINSIDVNNIKRKQNNYVDNIENAVSLDKKTVSTNNESCVDVTVEDAKNLEKKIINLIKKDLIKTVNELEILESELYLLSIVNGDEKTLAECRKNIDEVKKVLCKIDILKRKYDFLKDNYDFEYLLELDNNELIDNIIELKNMFDNNQVKALVEDYKLLDVYKYLYLRIDQIHDDTERFEEEKKKKEQELKERDIDFEKLKENVYNVQKMNESYDYFVKEQNRFLNDLEEKVSKIDFYERVNYKLKGFGNYLFNSFKYLGLLMMSPLRGVVPSIATQTLITKDIVSNLYKNLQWEEDRKMVYTATDYSSEIAGAIGDLDSTDKMVDSTLEDLVRLKMEYNDKFRSYQGDFSQYEEVIKKINDMENKILGNKIKIEIMKSRMLEKERENSNKLKRVRKLNDIANNTVN